MLFRMVPKPMGRLFYPAYSFRAMLFRMVPKHTKEKLNQIVSFRAMLFRMVPKLGQIIFLSISVLELCCFEWFQNGSSIIIYNTAG